MKLKCFAFYDSKGQFFMTPFFYPSVGQASRFFGDLLEDPKASLSKHPEDYSLYLLGEYDDGSGMMFPSTQPAHLISGIEYMRSRENLRSVKAPESEVSVPLNGKVTEVVR